MSLADATLRLVLLGDDVSASAALRRVGANATATQKRLALVSANMGKLGRAMTHAFTLPAIAIAAGSAKIATDFNTSMTRIQTQAGASAHDVKVLSDQVLHLSSKGVQQGPVELANSLYHLKSVGMDNADAMKALVQASHLAAVGNADLEETTNAVAGAWRTGIQGATSFKGAVSTLNAIIGAGNMSMADLNDAMSTGFLPSAKTFGLSLHDVGAALALFTDEGVPANVAATRLRMTFSLLGAPSTKAAEQLQSIGITAKGLAEEMRRGGLVGAIGLLKDHLQGLSKVDQSQLLSRAFGGGRSSSAILSMINNFDVLKMKEDQVTKGMSRFGADVAKQAETPQAKFKRLIAILETLGVEIGDKLLPMFTDWATNLNKFVGWFQALPPDVQRLASSFGLLLAGMGPALIMTSKMITAYQTLSTTMGNAGKQAAMFRTGAMVAGMALLTASTQTSNNTLKDFTSIAGGAAMGFAVGGPFGAAIGALGGEFMALSHQTKSAADAAKAAKPDWDALEGQFDSLSGSIDANTRKTVENQLAHTHTLSALAKYGISSRTAVNAILGEGNARKVVSAALKSQTAAIADQKHQIALLTAANVADEQNGTLNPKTQAARKRLIDQYKAQIAAERNEINTVRSGIPAFAAKHRAALQQIADTKDYTGLLKGLPKSVRVQFNAGNVLGTKKSIAAVAKAADLTPKQIKTVISATGATFTVGQIKKVEDGLTSVNKVKPNLTAYKASLQNQMDQAGGIARAGGTSVGYAMSNGLSAAIAADRARIAAQSADLVSNAILAARKAADAHSPSRKMIALGHDLADGLTIGITDRKQPLLTAGVAVNGDVSGPSRARPGTDRDAQFARILAKELATALRGSRDAVGGPVHLHLDRDGHEAITGFFDSRAQKVYDQNRAFERHNR